MAETIRIALAGNPNCGKTTMFNALTGSSQHVGNWPGVTVEKKDGKLKGRSDVIIQDLPGIYSLSPYTLEEVVTRNYLVQNRPDAIINIVDASNLDRNLYLTTQLLEIGIPVLVALNMMDVVKKRGDRINVKKLSEKLGCPVVETAAINDDGLKIAVDKAIELASAKITPDHTLIFSEPTNAAIHQISSRLQDNVPEANLMWYSIKTFERDQKTAEHLTISLEKRQMIDKIIAGREATANEDSESIITNERYAYIDSLVDDVLHKSNVGDQLTEKIDSIVTNRFLALPIFAAVMFLIYYISISTVGSLLTDWVNDGVFGEGWQLFGIWIPGIPVLLGDLLTAINCAEWLQSLVLDGIVAGVGAVLGFIPQMMVLFILLGILEDCGYMSRVAFIMDRLFRRFGLSGKNFIPMLVATGCGVPGVMATRTIENESDRKMAVMTTTFMPCGAKLPIIGLISGALFANSAWVAPTTYFIGIAAIAITGVILKKTKAFVGDPSPFVLELPSYHMPRPKNILLHMWERSKAFIKKACTIILLSTIVLWLLGSYNTALQPVDTADSILADVGQTVAPVFTPLGWGDQWEAVVGTVTGLLAKENVVATFGSLYAGLDEISEDGSELWEIVAAKFTPLAAFSFMLFNLLCAPCFAAIGAINREMPNRRWTLFAVAYQCGLAYVVAMIVYQLGTYITGGGFSAGTAAALLLLAGLIFLLFRPNPYKNKILQSKAETINSNTVGANN